MTRNEEHRLTNTGYSATPLVRFVVDLLDKLYNTDVMSTCGRFVAGFLVFFCEFVAHLIVQRQINNKSFQVHLTRLAKTLEQNLTLVISEVLRVLQQNEKKIKNEFSLNRLIG